MIQKAVETIALLAIGTALSSSGVAYGANSTNQNIGGTLPSGNVAQKSSSGWLNKVIEGDITVYYRKDRRGTSVYESITPKKGILTLILEGGAIYQHIVKFNPKNPNPWAGEFELDQEVDIPDPNIAERYKELF